MTHTFLALVRQTPQDGSAQLDEIGAEGDGFVSGADQYSIQVGEMSIKCV